MRIESFSGAHAFLSSFHPVVVYLDGVACPSVEVAYQAAKTLDPAERALIFNAKTPGIAKRLGRSLTIRPDWNAIRLDVMADLIRQKFAPGTPLAAQLLSTGDAELIEGNYWHDTFWGVCNGRGENHLGRLLMAQRAYLRSLTVSPTTQGATMARRTVTLRQAIDFEFERIKAAVVNLLVKNVNFETEHYFKAYPETRQFVRKVLPGHAEALTHLLDHLQEVVGDNLDDMDMPPSEQSAEERLAAERAEFEERVYGQYFLSTICRTGKPDPFDLEAVNTRTKAEFVARNADDSYTEPTLNAAWWAWQEARRTQTELRRIEPIATAVQSQGLAS